MKNLLFILSILFLMLLSCSSGDDGNGDDSNSSIIGVWKFTSVIYNYNGSSEEGITVCELAYNKMDFRSDGDLIWTWSTDDPSVALDDCVPLENDFTYSISDDQLTLINDSTNNAYPTFFIEELTSTKLKIVIFESNGIDNIVWTLTK
jgi:hypothetical protein